MKIVRIILLVIGALIAIVLIAPLFVKNEYSIKRDIVINKPKQEVFSYVKLLRNQDHYSKWLLLDPGMQKDFRGEDGTVGFVYAWESEEAGKGEQEIKGITEGERLDLEIRFVKPFESIAKTPMITEGVSENQTKVTWGMEGESPYPFNLMNLFMEGMLGKDLETSLATLKENLER